MNLGYLMIPDQSAPTRGAERMELARELGFSEFYTAERRDQYSGASVLSIRPEHEDALRTLPDLPKKQMPQIVAVDGERQASNQRRPSLENIARPSITPQQVATNARNRETTLSVSWLNKTELAHHWTAHVVGSTHAGIRARPENWRVARTILICNDTARAKATIMADDSPCRDYYAGIAPPGADVDALLEDCVIYGSLQTVLRKLHDISTISGPFGRVTLVDHAWPDADLAQQSLRTFASAYRPAPRRSCTSN